MNYYSNEIERILNYKFPANTSPNKEYHIRKNSCSIQLSIQIDFEDIDKEDIFEEYTVNTVKQAAAQHKKNLKQLADAIASGDRILRSYIHVKSDYAYQDWTWGGQDLVNNRITF